MSEVIAPGTPARGTETRTVVLAVAVLAVANVMSNRVLPGFLYIPWNVLVAAALTVLGLRHATRRELGLCEWRRGFLVGIVLVVATTVLLLIGLAMPSINELFEDRRVSTGVPTLVYQAAIRIPLGTVLLEELAFRAVLPGLLVRRHGAVRASVVASALFGLWHVLPALNINEVNPIARDVFGSGVAGKSVAVLFAVVGTMIAGLWLCLVRFRSRSVLAPMMGHLATNSIGYTIAWFVART